MYNMRCFRFLSVLIGLVCTMAAAQPPCSFTRFGRENGFAGTTVEDMAQDSHGELWLATWGGLYSFDGRTFQNYRTDLPDDRDNPRSNRFVEVRILPDGTRLVVSYDDRLYRFNPSTRVLDPVDSQGYAIQRIFLPEDGNCYYLTSSNEVLDQNFRPLFSVSREATVHGVECAPGEEPWILTERGIYRFAGAKISEKPAFCATLTDSTLYIGSSGEILRYRDQLLTSLPAGTSADIRFIVRVPGTQELLLGTDDGIEVHRPDDGTHTRLPFDNSSVDPGTLTCRTDGRGNIWIYSSAGSLYWYDKQAHRLLPLESRNLQQGWNSESGITTVFPDRQGNLWIGSTWGGLERVVFQQDNFKFRPIDGSGLVSAENNVRALAQDRSGRIFAATRDARLHAFSESLQELASWATGGPGYAVIPAHDGRIWVGTNGAGLLELSPQTADGLNFNIDRYPRDERFYGPNSNQIYSLLEDNAHRLWIGTFDDGVAYVNLDEPYRQFVSKRNRLSFPTERRNRMRCLFLGPDGRLYAGGQMGLFACERPDSEPEELHFERFEATRDIDIQHILFTRRGELYASSYGAGLLHFEGTSTDSGYRALTTDDGLLSDYVLSTIEDAAGNLWIATLGGLNRYNPETESLIGFPYDRIRHPMRFNEGQPLLARDGNLYFNTTGGILYFNPQEISNSDFVPDLVVQGFYVAGVRQDVDGVTALRIRPTDGIRVQFAAVDLSAPEQVLYSYKLEGRDKDWIPLGHQATVSIPPLRPGRYELHLRSTNGDGLAVDNGRTFTLLVRRVFIRSRWDALMFLLGAALLVFLLTRKWKKEPPAAAGADTPADPRLRELHGDDLRFAEEYIAFLESRIDDGTLDVGQMCDAMNVSRSVLFERCRTLLGTTPATFLRRLRLERAKQLIREGGRTMAEISYATGFNDPHYFSKIFKKEYGITPTEFRDEGKEAESAQ